MLRDTVICSLLLNLLMGKAELKEIFALLNFAVFYRTWKFLCSRNRSIHGISKPWRNNPCCKTLPIFLEVAHWMDDGSKDQILIANPFDQQLDFLLQETRFREELGQFVVWLGDLLFPFSSHCRALITKEKLYMTKEQNKNTLFSLKAFRQHPQLINSKTFGLKVQKQHWSSSWREA